MTTRTTKKNTKARPPAKTKAPRKGPNQAEKGTRADEFFDFIWKSRQKEREELVDMQRELREMVQDSQLRIMAMRTKGNLARLKIINKAFDD